MGEAYQGIEVPHGDPSGLRGAAASFAGLAGELEGAGAQLRAAPQSLGVWMGPAGVAYAGACLTNGGAAAAGVQALHTCSAVARTYAARLEAAQQDARRAIKDARAAQSRIDAAEKAVAAAAGEIGAATGRLVEAGTRLAVTGLAGTPDPSALAEQAAASRDLGAAQDAQARARHELDHAQEDLRRAKARGRRAMQDAREAAADASAAFGGVAAGGPSVGPAQAGAPASARTGGPGGWVIARGVFIDPFDVFSRGVEPAERQRRIFDRTLDGVTAWMEKGGEAAAARAMADLPVYREIQVRGHWRTTPSGGRTWVRPYTRRGALEGVEKVSTPESENLTRLSRAGKFGGPLLTGALGGVDQWNEDAGDPGLTTTDRVGRSVGVGAATAGGAYAGAELLGTIGTFIEPGGGTAVGGAVGAFVGAGVGAASVTVVPAVHHLAEDTGQWTANAATTAWDKTAGARHAVGHGIHDIEPWHW